ncbi:glutamate--cysteine ligase [Arthrobacter sp. Z1-15]
MLMNTRGVSSAGRPARTFGIEEEFLLVDPATGEPRPVAELALQQGKKRGGSTFGPALTLEVQQEQLEVVGPVCATLPEMEAAIREGRGIADEAARSVGARAVALATSPTAATPSLVPRQRYQDIADRFGLTSKEQLTCGFHVHVGVISGKEGVAILDRIRVWLPVLLALSANSPFWQGRDSGYASFRYQAWNRWPTAGPCERFGSEKAYRRYIRSLLATGVLVDEGMVYFDARLSRNHPTVEVRIADVCMDPGHAAVLAALVRALVEQAALDWRAGLRAPRQSAAQLRLAAWQASVSGAEGMLLHPLLNTPCPAGEAVQALLAHVSPVLASTGDEDRVTRDVARILTSGTGSRRQRETMASSRTLAAVVADAVEATHGTAKTQHFRPVRLQGTGPI